MRIPKKELIYYLGKDYNKIKFPEMIEILNKKGIPVTGKMTLEELFKMVKEHYAESIGEQTP